MINVSIIGASGYAGGELLRILLGHPKVKIQQATANRFSGLPVTINHPNLRGLTKLKYSKMEDLVKCDLLFIGLPNGMSQNHMDFFQKNSSKIIDLGADFRLGDKELWRIWYGSNHKRADLLNEFVYGLPELNAPEIKKAKYVAGPGCEAAVSILSLWPLVKHNIIKLDRIIIDAKMGSSQSGSKGSDSSHHPERSGSVRSYKPTNHRHQAEIERLLTIGSIKPQISVSATAIEMVRGILVTIHTFLKDGTKEIDVWKAYRDTYQDQPFIKLVKEARGLYRYPEPKILQGTNFCDIGFEKDPGSDRMVVIGAIDNLVKGTAGNAVQCMNLMYGWRVNLSLEFPGLHPV